MPAIISNSGPDSLTIVRNFDWNVEQYISTSKTFEWWVGEGPLFWYKIEWKTPLCPPGNCSPSVISCTTSAPCPNCLIASKTSLDTQTEVWHVQATSVADLCRRLNRECCNRNLYGKKVFKSVYKYDRPALCCDVEQYIISGIPITDTYVPVDFCQCECVSWVDPCDCGTFSTPCDDDVPQFPCTSSSAVTQLSTSILFGLPKIEATYGAGFNVSDIQIMKPQTDAVSTKYGIIPSNLKLKNNLASANFFKEFLSRNKLKLPEDCNLVYSKSSNAWQKVIHFNGHEENWVVIFSFSYTEVGWKAEVSVSKKIGVKKQTTKVVVVFSPNGDLKFLNFTYNVNTDKITTSHFVKSKSVVDEIGLFRGKGYFLSYELSKV